MENLLTETLRDLGYAGKTTDDVRWVGSRDGKLACSFLVFAVIANFDYDDGYGGNEIAGDLVVVGDDWWLERGEYDGSEWWEFKRMPILSKDHEIVKNVRNIGYTDHVS